MKEDPIEQTLKPFDFSQILAEVPELGKFAHKIDSYTFTPLIDSSDIEPSLWVAITELIEKRYDDYDGFVILHGTDTMAYTASALSFMLENLDKPVVITGSQIPLCELRSDGRDNLITSLVIANDAVVKEVCLYFGGKLMRGNRATKFSADKLIAFKSCNYALHKTLSFRIS